MVLLRNLGEGDSKEKVMKKSNSKQIQNKGVKVGQAMKDQRALVVKRDSIKVSSPTTKDCF